jgi:hypothetical protein
MVRAERIAPLESLFAPVERQDAASHQAALHMERAERIARDLPSHQAEMFPWLSRQVPAFLLSCDTNEAKLREWLEGAGVRVETEDEWATARYRFYWSINQLFRVVPRLLQGELFAAFAKEAFSIAKQPDARQKREQLKNLRKRCEHAITNAVLGLTATSKGRIPETARDTDIFLYLERRAAHHEGKGLTPRGAMIEAKKEAAEYASREYGLDCRRTDTGAWNSTFRTALTSGEAYIAAAKKLNPSGRRTISIS